MSHTYHDNCSLCEGLCQELEPGTLEWYKDCCADLNPAAYRACVEALKAIDNAICKDMDEDKFDMNVKYQTIGIQEKVRVALAQAEQP